MQWFRKAIPIFEELTRRRPNVTSFLQDLGKTYGNVAMLHNLIGETAEAERLYQVAIQIQERLLQVVFRIEERQSAETEFEQDLAKTYNDRGILQLATGQTNLAMPSLQEAIKILNRLTRDHPEVVAIQQELARGLASLGDLQRITGSLPEAARTFLQAIRIQERLAQEHPGIPEFQSDLSVSYLGLGRLRKASGQSAEAIDAWRKAERCIESRTAPSPYDLYNLACVRSLSSELIGADSSGQARGDDSQRKKLTDRAIDALRRAVAAGFSDVAQLEKDADLEPLRSRAELKAIIAKLRSN
jgi:tetratricopeptide (TPR) repeat protein